MMELNHLESLNTTYFKVGDGGLVAFHFDDAFGRQVFLPGPKINNI